MAKKATTQKAKATPKVKEVDFGSEDATQTAETEGKEQETGQAADSDIPAKATRKKRLNPGICSCVKETTEEDREKIAAVIGEIALTDGFGMLIDRMLPINPRNLAKLPKEIGQPVNLAFVGIGDTQVLGDYNYQVTKAGWKDIGKKNYHVMVPETVPNCCAICENLVRGARGAVCKVDGHGNEAAVSDRDKVEDFGRCDFFVDQFESE